MAQEIITLMDNYREVESLVDDLGLDLDLD